METPSFALQAHVDYLYENKPRRLAFAAQSIDEFQHWQAAFRAELVNLLGLAGRAVPKTPRAERLQSIDRGDYIEEKYALDVGDNVPAPMYVLVPKTDPPYKPIVAFHGHAPSVQYMLGNYPNEEIEQERREADGNYAQALAQAGYLVCAVEQRGFGERVTDQRSGPNDYRSCRHLAFEYMMQGRTLVGERCWDGMVAISYVQNRPDVMAGVMGCTGNSGGGTTTQWLSAIDDRITVIVTSCYFCAFKQSILGVQHCECNYVPGILELGEMGDMGALLAPRPFRVIAGEQDPIFPAAGVRQEFETVQRAYELWDVPEKASLTFHPGGHAYNHALSHEWFAKWL